MGFLDELKRLARPYEDEVDDYEEFEPVSKPERKRSERLSSREESVVTAEPRDSRNNNKVVNIHTTTQLQVVLVKPDRFEAAAEVADHLCAKRTVVMNLEAVGKDVARRLLDFVSGVAYASGGKIQKVALDTFIITPFNVDIMGDLMCELENNGLYNF